MTKRPKIIHLNSKEIYYNINNLPIPQATGGTTYWSLSRGEQILAEISTNANEKGSMQFDEFEGKLGLLIRYRNLSFIEPYTGITITLSYGDTVITGDTQVSAKVTFEELLSMNIDIELLEAHPMILEYTTTEDNETVGLPLMRTNNTLVDVNIDWDDGSQIEHVTSLYPAHTYANAGIYNIKINGTVGKLYALNFNSAKRNHITGIKSWGKLDGLEEMGNAFQLCLNLKGEIPSDTYGMFENISDFNETFNGSSGITSISEELFVNCPNVTSFSSCFKDCTSLTSIPENLFANCPNVTNFYDCFNNCNGLTGYTPVDTLPNGTMIELWERQGKEGYPASINGRYCFIACRKLSNYNAIPPDWGGPIGG